MRIKLHLTPKQRDQIWGEDGPYSEARLIYNTRILDDQVSRVFIEIEIAINPLTFRIVKKHRDLFKDDPIIQQLLDHSHYRGQPYGYVSSAFCKQDARKKIKEEADKHLQYSIQTIIKMHKFVINYFNSLN